MPLDFQEKDGVAVFRLSGRLDSHTVSDIEGELHGCIEKGHLKMIINFRNLEYISSAGLRCILTTAKKMQHQNGRLLLTDIGGVIMEIFELAGFFTLLPVYASEDEALEQLA